MANRLTHKRRKCVKSPNIFRDKQEYSSLYTISSRSASSVQSLEMASQISKQNSEQVRVYKGQHHKGDSASTPVRGNPQNYGGKYPKLPSEITQELQQKVYSNSHKSYYSDRSQFIKNKFDKLTLENNSHHIENKQPFTKSHGIVHTSPPPNHHYTINRLEESYWAKWKPNRCDEINTYRNYLDQTACNRGPHCVTTRMLPQECAKMLAHTTCKRPHQNKCDEKRLKMIREPADIRESNSSDIGLNNKKTAEKKSKRSCCNCPRDESISDGETSLQRASLKNKEDAERKCELKQGENTEEENNLDTTQEEYENLYNQMYQEYETDLMNRISEYEMQREEEEMRDMERQLAEQEEERRNEQEDSKTYRYGANEHAAEAIQNQEMRENGKQFSNRQLKQIRISSQDKVKFFSREEELLNYSQEEDFQLTTDLDNQNVMNTDEHKYLKPVNPEEYRSSVERHYPSEPIHYEEESENRLQSMNPEEHPCSAEQRRYYPSEDQEEIQNSPLELKQVYPEERPLGNIQERERHDIEELYIKKVEERTRPSNEGREEIAQTNAEERRGTPTNSEERASNFSEDRGLTNTGKHTHNIPTTQSLETSNNPVESARSSPNDKTRGIIEKQEEKEAEKETPGTVDEWEDYQKMERLLRKASEKESTLHLSTSVEYSEPEFTILKHTDSFIINSRRQKEDRPRKPQPKFIKLTKPTFSPTVKGHTYPLKPALKRERAPSQPVIGFSRPLSPNTPKVRSSSKQFLPSYLLRH